MATTKTRPSSISVSPAQKSESDLEQAIKAKEVNDANRDLRRVFRDEEKMVVTISPMYAPYFSDNMCVDIGGYTIFVPCDGNRYEVPQSFGEIINDRIAYVDKKIRLANNMSNVQNNCESYAGEVDMIRAL